MARIFITGSADGLGQLAAEQLIAEGHQVVLHARNAERSHQALAKLPGAEKVLTADLSDLTETKQLAAAVNALGRFDAIIHNAGVYQAAASTILSVNVLAPYVLTCLIQKPQRLIYLSSGMHRQGNADLKSLEGKGGSISYSDSKLYDTMLAMAVACKWQDVFSNSVDPGWVPTKMGGAGAPDNLQKGYETQVWLATSDDEKAKVSGRYFHHKKEDRHLPQAAAVNQQEALLAVCEQLTGVRFPTE